MRRSSEPRPLTPISESCTFPYGNRGNIGAGEEANEPNSGEFR